MNEMKELKKLTEIHKILRSIKILFQILLFINFHYLVASWNLINFSWIFLLWNICNEWVRLPTAQSRISILSEWILKVFLRILAHLSLRLLLNNCLWFCILYIWWFCFIWSWKELTFVFNSFDCYKL